MEVQCSFEGLLRVLQVYTAIRVLSDRLQFQIGRRRKSNSGVLELEWVIVPILGVQVENRLLLVMTRHDT
jgi:hypothetical protein